MSTSPADTITITREAWEEACDARDLLWALQAHGVDNWDFYDDALESLEAEDEA